MKAQLTALFVACSMGCSQGARTDADPRLKSFATQKWQQTEEFAAKLHLRIPRATRKLFKAAEAGDWITVSNQFARIRPLSGQYRDSKSDPAFQNVLWIPVQETASAYEMCNMWPPSVADRYARRILEVIPSNSVYFGGTDPGRFAVTFLRDLSNSPDIFVITQNGLAESRYAEYLRLTYGKQLVLPSVPEVQTAFQQFARDYQSRPPNEYGQVTVSNGQVSVTGAATVMEINGILSKMIFDHNKAHHDFYVEESFVIDWMYPYLEPHGPILKLNSGPLAQLDPGVVEQDRRFWDAFAKELLADPILGQQIGWRSMYAKLRSAIGGVYAFRHMTNEAEAAFQQAVEIGPVLQEAPFRLAQMYCGMGRFDDAVATLEHLQKRAPEPNITDAIKQIRDLKLQSAKKQSS